MLTLTAGRVLSSLGSLVGLGPSTFMTITITYIIFSYLLETSVESTLTPSKDEMLSELNPLSVTVTSVGLG